MKKTDNLTDLAAELARAGDVSALLRAAEQRVLGRAKDLAKLDAAGLSALAADIRTAILAATSASGGHVSPNLGVVELSIALWRVFDPYADRLFWDVSHQIYAHKLLSGRSLANLRQFGGPSGYSEPAESGADVLCAGHSSTSISLAVGTAKALALAGSKRRAVAIIGDGAMGSGLAYEALNELGALRLPAVVVLNDNKMSISAPIGALSRFLSQSIASSAYQRFRRGVLRALEHLPDSARYAAKRAEDSLKLASPAGMFFEELGLSYIGPIDGHDIAACERALKLAQGLGKPALVHVITQKGRGYAPAERDETGKWHGVGPFELEDSLALADVGGAAGVAAAGYASVGDAEAIYNRNARAITEQKQTIEEKNQNICKDVTKSNDLAQVSSACAAGGGSVASSEAVVHVAVAPEKVAACDAYGVSGGNSDLAVGVADGSCKAKTVAGIDADGALGTVVSTTAATGASVTAPSPTADSASSLAAPDFEGSAEDLAGVIASVAPNPSPTPSATAKSADTAAAPSPTPSATAKSADTAAAPSPTPSATATAAFSAALLAQMAANPRVVAITAAMPSGTGLDAALAAYPDRCWDVGIAEAHACTQSAALAAAGLRPVVAVYSTFAQRAIDSIIHDIALNAAPVVLALDRAGIVGQDGKTHQGVFDLALLRCVPGMHLFAPVGVRSMGGLLAHAITLNAPSALRYARGAFALAPEFDRPEAAPYFIRERGSRVLALGWGEGVADALAVGDAHGFDVANLVCAKPLCEHFLARLRGYERVLVYSHTARVGGLGELLAAAGVRTASWEFEDAFITHGQTPEVLRSLGRDQASLIAAAAEFAGFSAGSGGDADGGGGDAQEGTEEGR